MTERETFSEVRKSVGLDRSIREDGTLTSHPRWRKKTDGKTERVSFEERLVIADMMTIQERMAAEERMNSRSTEGIVVVTDGTIMALPLRTVATSLPWPYSVITVWV